MFFRSCSVCIILIQGYFYLEFQNTNAVTNVTLELCNCWVHWRCSAQHAFVCIQVERTYTKKTHVNWFKSYISLSISLGNRLHCTCVFVCFNTAQPKPSYSLFFVALLRTCWHLSQPSECSPYTIVCMLSFQFTPTQVCFFVRSHRQPSATS